MAPRKATSPASTLPRDLLAEILPIVREINAVLDPEALLADVARQLRRLVDFEILDILLMQPDGSLRAAYVEGHGVAAAGHALAPGRGIVGAAAAERRTLFVPDVARDPRYVPLAPGVVAELAIPLVHREAVVGVLNIEGRDATRFTPEVVTALELLADHLAVAIANATAHRETQRYAELLARLYEIARETSSILDLDRLLQRVAEAVKQVIDYEMFGILLLEEASGELVLRQSVRFGDFPSKPRIKVGEGLCGAAAALKEPVRVGNVAEDPRYLRLIPQTRSELVVPLVHKDRVVGVFDLESTELDRFTEEHVRILTLVAAQVAVAIDNARLYEEIRRKETRIARELQIARRVQHGLFPEETPSGPGWEAWAEFLPASELGGDLYDFYPLDAGLLGLAVGDVAGKGVAAALYAAFASGTVRSRAFQRQTPAELLARVNRTLRRRGVEGMYCTLTYALFDFRAATLRLASSGLPYPFHYRAARGRSERLELAGLPLGVFEHASYEERVVPLEPGDVLVLFTDGLSEARRRGEDYDIGRLGRVLEAEAGAGAGVARIGEALLADLNAFLGGGAAADDVTLVVMKVLGAAPPAAAAE